MTELSLDISRSNNLKVLRLYDTSIYSPTDTIANYIIEVLPVNKQAWLTFYVEKQFSLALNSSSLGYKRANSTADLADLPDGVYEIKQSYKPNAVVVVHYFHLRATQLHLKYLELLCSHFSRECRLDMRQYSAEAEKLVSIKQYIDAAEYTVNDKHNKKDGIKYYNKAIDMIKDFENECCR